MAVTQTEDEDAVMDDSNLAAVSQVEAGIRDFVRNDIAYLRRAPSHTASSHVAPSHFAPSHVAPSLAPEPQQQQPQPQLDVSAEATVATVSSLIQRVAGVSLGEIENLVQELESLRDLLHTEGQRVQREIAGYAQLSQAAIKSTRMIADNVAQWKRAAEGIREP